MATTSPVTQINDALRRAGRAERLVRGRGYWYLYGGDASRFQSSIFCAYSPYLSTVDASLKMIADRFADNGVPLDFDRLNDGLNLARNVDLVLYALEANAGNSEE